MISIDNNFVYANLQSVVGATNVFLKKEFFMGAVNFMWGCLALIIFKLPALLFFALLAAVGLIILAGKVLLGVAIVILCLYIAVSMAKAFVSGFKTVFRVEIA
jgi:hypothetical protein